MTDLLHTILRLAVTLVYIALLHKTYLDGCRAAMRPELVRVSETQWIYEVKQ